MTNIPHPAVPTSPGQATSPLSEEVPAARLIPQADCESPLSRPRTQPTRPTPTASVPGGVQPPSPNPDPAPAAPLIPWSPRSTCLSLFSERPTGACRGAASEADRARGWGSPRRTRPRSSRQRGRQKPCSALMGPNPLGCRVWVTARRAGVSLRLRREPGRLYGLQLGRGRAGGSGPQRTKEPGMKRDKRPVTSVLGSSRRSRLSGLAKAAVALPGYRRLRLRGSSPV